MGLAWRQDFEAAQPLRAGDGFGRSSGAHRGWRRSEPTPGGDGGPRRACATGQGGRPALLEVRFGQGDPGLAVEVASQRLHVQGGAAAGLEALAEVAPEMADAVEYGVHGEGEQVGGAVFAMAGIWLELFAAAGEGVETPFSIFQPAARHPPGCRNRRHPFTFRGAGPGCAFRWQSATCAMRKADARAPLQPGQQASRGRLTCPPRT